VIARVGDRDGAVGCHGDTLRGRERRATDRGVKRRPPPIGGPSLHALVPRVGDPDGPVGGNVDACGDTELTGLLTRPAPNLDERALTIVISANHWMRALSESVTSSVPSGMKATPCGKANCPGSAPRVPQRVTYVPSGANTSIS
jgi:hypothetical protein